MTKRKSDSTEEDRLKRLTICKFCHETLEDPIILPCFKTISSKHLLNETNNFKCNLCDNSHDKTLDKFPANEFLNVWLETCDEYVKLSSIGLCKEYKLAKDQCKLLNDLINESELLIKDPVIINKYQSLYITDYFSKLRNEVDLSKDQKIQDIVQKHEQIINNLKEIERKCTFEAQSKHFKRLDEIIIEEKKKLMEWSFLLETNSNRESLCEDISNESIQSINELKFEMNECQNDLLDNKQYKFKSISNQDSIFGDLEIIDENHFVVSLIQTLEGHTDFVRKLTFLQNGNKVSSSFDKTINIWNQTTGALIQTLTGSTSGVRSLTVLPNGNLVSGSWDKTIKIWNPTTGELIQTLTGLADAVYGLTILQNGNLVSCSGDKTIKIWNPTTGTLIQTLTGHKNAVFSLTVLQNGNLVSSSSDKTIKIFSYLKTFKCLFKISV